MALEDWTGDYTLVNGGSKLTVTDANTITFADVTRNNDHYVYADSLGAGYWSGDFQHNYDLTVASSSGNDSDSIMFVHSLTNELEDWINSSGNRMGHFVIARALLQMYLRETVGTNATDSVTGLAYDTVFSCEFERDEAVGTYGTIYLRIYDGVSLVDTLSVTLRSNENFEYHMTCQSLDQNNDTGNLDGTVEDLDLNEAVAATHAGPLVNATRLKSKVGGGLVA